MLLSEMGSRRGPVGVLWLVRLGACWIAGMLECTNNEEGAGNLHG